MIKKLNGFNYNSSSSAVLNKGDLRLYVRGTTLTDETKPQVVSTLFEFCFYFVLDGMKESDRCYSSSLSSSFRASSADPLCLNLKFMT